MRDVVRICPGQRAGAREGQGLLRRVRRPSCPGAWRRRGVPGPERRRGCARRRGRGGDRGTLRRARAGPWRRVPPAAGRSPGERDGSWRPWAQRGGRATRAAVAAWPARWPGPSAPAGVWAACGRYRAGRRQTPWPSHACDGADPCRSIGACESVAAAARRIRRVAAGRSRATRPPARRPAGRAELRQARRRPACVAGSRRRHGVAHDGARAGEGRRRDRRRSRPWSRRSPPPPPPAHRRRLPRSPPARPWRPGSRWASSAAPAVAGSAGASAARSAGRWASAVLNCRQARHERTCARMRRPRSTRPSPSDSARWTSAHRHRPALRALAAEPARASKIVCLTARAELSSTTAISSCESPLSSRRTSAKRWRSGRSRRSARSSARSLAVLQRLRQRIRPERADRIQVHRHRGAGAASRSPRCGRSGTATAAARSRAARRAGPPAPCAIVLCSASRASSSSCRIERQ